MIFLISSILVAFTSISLAFVTLYKSKNRNLARIWFFFCLSVCLWGIGGTVIAIEKSQERIIFWWRISEIGIFLIPIFYYRFVYELTKIGSKNFLRIIYFLYAVFFFFNLQSDKLFGLKLVTGHLYWKDWWVYKNPVYLLSSSFFYGFLLLYSFLILVISFLRSQRLDKMRLKYFIIGSLVGWVGGISNFLITFGWNFYPYFNTLIALYTLIFAYAIIKFRLMDISLAITRTGIFVTVYSFILGIPFVMAYTLKPQLIELLGINWWILPLVSSTVLATAGPFIYLYIQKQAEDRLLREQRAYQMTLRGASQGMNQVRDLNKLLNLIVRIVTRTVRLKNGAIYLLDEEKQVYVLKAVRDLGRNVASPNSGLTISPDSVLARELLRGKEPLVYEEIKQRLQDYQDSNLASLEAQMKQINAAVAVPSFAGEEMVGFLVLGEKISGKLYSQDDLVVFSVLANQAALAIENAKFYEDIKKTQQQLFQAEKMATIGTMANGLSHQISNRFQALGFIAGDTLDTVKMAGDKPYPPEVKELLATISAALEKVLANVTHGGEVVKGMLKYSRPGQEGFEPINLDQLLTASLEMAQYKVKLDSLDIIRDFAKDLPAVRGNSTQLQEVFFNLIDNAYDAITQRKDELQESDFKGKITISASVLDGNLEIRFRDNGMGVKGADSAKLFTPFFTTKTSSKKGTGLGLYVIQKIIVGNHGGKIRMESKYKEGTAFIIELPISRG
jgi:signal transduction histidine kinase